MSTKQHYHKQPRSMPTINEPTSSGTIKSECSPKHIWALLSVDDSSWHKVFVARNDGTNTLVLGFNFDGEVDFMSP